VDLRSFAYLTCRLLALYLAVDVIAGLPADVAMARSLRDVSAGAAPSLLLFGEAALHLAMAAALWFAASSLSSQLAGVMASRAGARRASADDLPRAVVIATGVLVIAGGIGSAVVLIEMFWPGGSQSESVRQHWAGVVAALAVRVALGAALIIFATPLLALLRGKPKKPEPVDTSVAGMLTDLVGAAGSYGVRRVTDLALSLKAEAEGVAMRVVRSSLDRVITAVEQRRPDFSAATAADGTVTIVFSDMEGFTAMTQRLGDHQAHEVIKAHNRIVRLAVKGHGGKEVELQGDGFLLAFPRAAAALHCAGVIHRECAAYSETNADAPIRVRIGLNTGKPIKNADRFFGISVILAARIAAQAQGGETLVSTAVREDLADDATFVFDEGREAELKGLDGRHRMFRVLRYGER
jgi:class 3 adenylate cyclase